MDIAAIESRRQDIKRRMAALDRLSTSDARDFVGMAGQARPIRLEAVRAECDRTDTPEGNFQKVMLIEAVLFPVRYLKK